ncbi:hypothetical protein M413DRAFT_448926 [Hebeloma cylindrosporum]|uniref:Cysteine-rich transmembrane CYSTM domain-containing protein n=1 Tax=Hebeloma cylindrosporum TaxID=76867 RepID=A0A0C2Y6X8_HEBCY|nr:hypothetical protein M413DRAFT_448926 [Hebeloma cylindrosporum h7]
MADVVDCCGCFCLCCACATACGRLCLFIPCFKTKRSKEEEEDEAYAQAVVLEGANGRGAQGPYTYQQPTPHRGPMLPEPAHMSYPPNPNDKNFFVQPHHQNGYPPRPPQQTPAGQQPTFATSDNPSHAGP